MIRFPFNLVNNFIHKEHIMKKNYIILSFIIFSCILNFTCTQQKNRLIKSKPDYKIIAAHTSNTISRDSAIEVLFTESVKGDSIKLNEPLEKSPFIFEPEINGKAIWENDRTLRFVPEKRLTGGVQYTAYVDLSKTSIPKEKQHLFSFDFLTTIPSFDINLSGLQAINQNSLHIQQLKGQITTLERENHSSIENILKAYHNNKELSIDWTHLKDNLTHLFCIQNIERGEEKSDITLEWDGKFIGSDKKGKRLLEVPPIHRFIVLDAKPVQGDEQYIEIRFSDPLDRTQDMQGLIRIKNVKNFKFHKDRSILKVYTTASWPKKTIIDISSNIKNAIGQKLINPKKMTVYFQDKKPEVRFIGKGVIVPTMKDLTVPIKTMNLKALNVEVLQIFEKNIPQFLQVNNLDGNSELKRVGRLVWKKTIELKSSSIKKNKWTIHGLDLSQLTQEDPKGIYRIYISFSRKQIMYTCNDLKSGEDTNKTSDIVNTEEEEENSFWDSYEGEFDYESYDNRRNPCHRGFYKIFSDHNITVARNVLISDIGLIAKKGTNDEVFITVTDIKSAKPIQGANLKILNYQQQIIDSQISDKNGMAIHNTPSKPFLISAHYNNQVGFLKLDDGSALSVSHFDVSGMTIQKGLKGFFYGERGVWRPGDPIYLTFILFDNDNQLPDDHPVRFELRNPRDQLIETEVKKKSLNGFYCFNVQTDQDAITGNWNAKVKVGGATFEKKLKIATVKPNRLKIKLDFGEDIKSLSKGKLSFVLSSKWLHGAIAKNFESDINLSFTPRKTRFSKYGHYIFDDPVRKFRSGRQQIYKGKLDQNGFSVVHSKIHAKKTSPGMLNANFTTRVFEPGGDYSVDYFSIPYHPYENYIGIQLPKGDKARGMLLTDVDHTARIVMLDNEGKPVKKGEVEIKMYKIKWRWWWEKGKESISSYLGSKAYQPIKSGIVPIVDGKGEWSFKIKYPEWGRYFVRAIDIKGKHATGKIVYIDWPGWAGRAQNDSPGGASVLNFSSNKDNYKVGEDIILTIPTGKEGRGLLSIESGSKVVLSSWFESKQSPKNESTIYQFKASKEMAPNIFVHITLIQPHMNSGNDHPVRMYGVIPLKILDPETVLSPEITVPKTLIPGEINSIQIKEAKGKQMTYTIAIVDDGLLDITRFKTPDPWNHFYKREALGVKTWDLYDSIIGAYGSKFSQILAIGGDDAMRKKGKKRANRFPPMVRFLGPFFLEKDNETTHEVDIPQYVGSVRVMAVAGYDGAFGAAEKNAFVRKPLMLLGTLPRVLGPKEEVTLPVSVFAMDKTIQKVSVSLNVDGPISIIGQRNKNIEFTEPGDQLLEFKLKTTSTIDKGIISIHAQSDKNTAYQKIEIDIRNPNVPVTDQVKVTIPENKHIKQKIVFPGAIGTNKITLEISRIQWFDFGKRLSYLIRYPHGCLEQITSSVFPQLFLDKLMDLSPKKHDAIQKNIKAGIERLRGFQTSEGAFSFWPGSEIAQEWVTNYAGHFLVEAEKCGYLVPQEMIVNWKKFQTNKSHSWLTGSEKSALIQAYRLYTLALYGTPELGAMNRLREEIDLPSTARLRLAACYELAGQPEAANQLLENLKISVSSYQELSNTFGSTIRDKAMILESLCILKKFNDAEIFANEISKELDSDKELSTQTISYALIALSKYSRVTEKNIPMDVSYQWHNEEITIDSHLPIVQRMLISGKSKEGILDINNNNTYELFLRIIMEGIPEIGKEKSAQNNLKISVDYTNLKGKKINPLKLNQGDDIIANVSVTNTGKTGKYEGVALTHSVPSGWEIHNTRISDAEINMEKIYDYQDIRDDRIYTYFSLKQNETKAFTVLLNAGYLGKYYIPMIHAETMYNPAINARVAGKWGIIGREK